MTSLKVQEVCELPSDAFYCHLLKGNILHWVQEDKYHRFDISTQVELEPIVLPLQLMATSKLVSVDEEQIEVLGRTREKFYPSSVFFISLRTLEVLEETEPAFYSDGSNEILGQAFIGDTLHYAVGSIMKEDRNVEIIPLSRHGMYSKIEVPEKHTFQSIIPGDKLQYITEEFGGYNICSPEGTKFVECSSVYKEEGFISFSVLQDHLILLSKNGIIVDGCNRIDTGWYGNVEIVSPDHFILHHNRMLCRIKDTQDIKVKSCTKRT